MKIAEQACAHDHGCGCSSAAMHAGVESVVLAIDGAKFDIGKVNVWMSEVLWEKTAGHVYRCKGIFRDADNNGHALQGVGNLFETEEVAKAEIERAKFLFVGRELDRAVLEKGMHAAMVGNSA